MCFCFKISFFSFFWHNNRFHHWLYFRFTKSNQFSDLQFASSYQKKIYWPIDCRYFRLISSFQSVVITKSSKLVNDSTLFLYFAINTFLASIYFLSFWSFFLQSSLAFESMIGSNFHKIIYFFQDFLKAFFTFKLFMNCIIFLMTDRKRWLYWLQVNQKFFEDLINKWNQQKWENCPKLTIIWWKEIVFCIIT